MLNKISAITKSNTESSLYELSEIMDSILQNKVKVDNNTKKEIIKNIKEILQKNPKGNIGLAQINPIVGDIEYNAQKVAKYIKYAQDINLDMVIFPELILMGYPIEDTIDRHPIIVEENIKWLKEIAAITKSTVALVGFIEPRKYNISTGKSYYNSVAILQDGEIKGIVRKSLLPTYSEFNDYRYIEPSPVVGVQPDSTLCLLDEENIVDCDKTITINGIKYGISICEDCWNNKDFFDKTLYSKDPIEELAAEKPDILINCSASPSRAKKEQLKHNMLSFISNSYKMPMVYVNQVGAIDNSSFEGSSRAFSVDGALIARAKSFEEQFIIVNPIKKIGKIYPLTKGLEKTLREQKVFTLEYENDLERTYKTIKQGIKDYFQKTGFERAVLGLSGGLDSTVCAVLLADALGKENVFGISMPSKITSKESRSDAETLAINLGINFTEVSIKEMVETTNRMFNTLFSAVESKWNCRYKESFTQDNIQARSRAMYLWGISNEFAKCLPIATSDKSELYMGYATINGDMSGGFAPIADVPKTKLFAFAKWLNKNRKEKNAIPEAIILKKPGAELAIDPKTGKPLVAEDALMPYEFLDEIIWRIENKHEHYWDLMTTKFQYEIKNNITQEQKAEWLDKFYRRMSTALYKWSILPPSVIVESRSINKYDYKQPITSSRINYKGSSQEEIRDKLNKSI
ncbi:MAG: NAD(+) synthase [Candidatus Gastranaerophilaceae bacterium]